MSVSASAADVLPIELLREVQKHWQGGLLWIPAVKRMERSEQDEQALLLIQAGLSAKDVAESCNLKQAHVYFIANRLGEKNPYRKKTADLQS